MKRHKKKIMSKKNKTFIFQHKIILQIKLSRKLKKNIKN